MDNTLKPFLVRLRPRARVLLDRAAEVELRSRASVIDELISIQLERSYGVTTFLATSIALKGSQ